MCRIAGIISKTISSTDLKLGLTAMLKSMERGGPDDEGIYTDHRLVLGHRRLSIIDLSSAGHQPMVIGDDDVVITFNGEIYNYLEIKKELESLGKHFTTKTDTEVILQAFLVWGTDSFDRFHGIFAFALYDKRYRKIFLVRDQIGIKPLYYYQDDKELIFSSEIRGFNALRKWPENQNWKIFFLAFGSIPHPYSTLAEVLELSPGYYLEFDLDSFRSEIVSFYNPQVGPSVADLEEASKMMEQGVKDAVTKNFIADAPLGVFLSGGIDSSLLTLLADRIRKNIKTVSVNFDESSFDESQFQKIVLQKTQHVEHNSFHVTEKKFWDELDDVWLAMDQPTLDGVNAYFISQCATNEGMKVALSGLGADEFFGGYRSFNRVFALSLFRWIPFKELLSNILGVFKKSYLRLRFLRIKGPVGDYLFLRGICTPEEIAQLLGIPEKKVWQVLSGLVIEVPKKLSSMEYVSFLESKIYMTNQLLKDMDFMSMWHGLEVRVPFLDIELLRKLKSIPSSIRYKGKAPKHFLTHPFRDILPREIVFRKKSGFTFPFSIWIRKNLNHFSQYILNNDASHKTLAEFKVGNVHWSKVWCLAVLKQFEMKTTQEPVEQL